MFKKVFLGSVALASTIYASQSDVDVKKLQEDIAKAKAQKAKIEAVISDLEAKLPPNNQLVTHTELGYIKTLGNTKTETFNLETKFKKGWDNIHIINWLFDAQYASDENGAIKNKFFTELKYDYKFTDRFSINYLVGYKRDKFSVFDYQFYTGPGVMYDVVKTAKHNLSLELSALYSKDEYYQNDEHPNGLTNDYTSARAKGLYSWQVLDNLKFEEEASYRVDLEHTDNYFVYSATKLTSKLSDIFSAGVGYKIDYVNQPGDFKRVDETFTANLIIDY